MVRQPAMGRGEKPAGTGPPMGGGHAGNPHDLLLTAMR